MRFLKIPKIPLGGGGFFSWAKLERGRAKEGEQFFLSVGTLSIFSSSFLAEKQIKLRWNFMYIHSPSPRKLIQLS